jgi:Signal transduction histidine kinase
MLEREIFLCLCIDKYAAFLQRCIFRIHRYLLGSRVKIIGISFILFLVFGCGRGATPTYSPQERQSISDIVRASRNNTDSLEFLLLNYTAQNNLFGNVLVNKELGRRYRENSMFNEALAVHRAGLESAQQLGDTLEIVQALNNIATNYRRMGVLDEASTYHYRALTYSELYSDKESSDAKKNRLVSLNGIGNIHLTLNNRELAESIFRQALVGERELRSDLGMAINYANIGSIFESREMIDSAYYYYQKSMEHNRLAKSDLGISLCHNHFGRLAEKRGAWNAAILEYQNAYEIMENSGDRWHWLESCISLARVNNLKGDIYSAERYLALAQKTASEINSWEHLSEVHRLQYLLSKENRDYSGALEHYIYSKAYSDSVRNEENINHMQNMRVNYEREKGLRELALVQENYKIEQRNKRVIIVAGISIFSLAAIAFGFLLYALRMKSRTQRAMRKMEQVRQSFFTNITHEFRTPMTVILGLTEQMKSQSEKNEFREKLETISKHGNSLLELINQLLDISKIRSEVDNPDWKNGDIVAYIDMIVESYRIYARQQLIDLEFLSAEVSINMDFVPSYIDKIIRNLLSNAIKFTSRGGQIYLTVAQEKNCSIIRIADTGTGIPAKDIPYIFDSFYQGANSSFNTGTGVGLSLVRQMTEAMGGTIEVKSAEGSGTIFTLAIPLKHGERALDYWLPQPPEKEISSDELERGESVISDEENDNPILLIVEDNTDVAGYIGSLLKDRYRLIFARNGREGLDKALEYMPDLILTDLMMPEMDGYEMCNGIRRSDILNHIPIIIITARSEDSDKILGLEAGADAYLLKPFNAAELNIRVSKLLEQRRLLREKYSIALRSGVEQKVELLISDRDFLNRLTDIICSNISINSLTSVLTDRICMSQSQLNRKVKSITGYNTSAYVLQIRMEQAQRMLASTEESIGEIADKCGFDDQSHFTRAFRQMMGITPSKYRKRPKK